MLELQDHDILVSSYPTKNNQPDRSNFFGNNKNNNTTKNNKNLPSMVNS